MTPQTTFAVLGDLAFTNLTADAAVNDRPVTLLRMVGSWSLGDPGANGFYEAALGVSVMSEAGMGGLALPEPISDSNQSWYYWDHMRANLNVTGLGRDKVFDIRTARVIRPGFRLVLILEAGVIPSGVKMTFSARLLWGL